MVCIRFYMTQQKTKRASWFIIISIGISGSGADNGHFRLVITNCGSITSIHWEPSFVREVAGHGNSLLTTDDMSSSQSELPVLQEEDNNKSDIDKKEGMTVGSHLHFGPSLPYHNDTVSLTGNEESVESPTEEGQSHEKSSSVLDESGETICQLRRSNRDINSIRLSGTALTFYRRLHALFFSNPTHKRDYESLILNGCSKRRRNSLNNCNSPSLSKSKRQQQQQQQQSVVKVKRESRRRDAPIYVIDNFLTESELEYFDKTIESVRFERSFVDNMNYDDDNDDDDADENNNDEGDDQEQTEHGKNDGSHDTATDSLSGSDLPKQLQPSKRKVASGRTRTKRKRRTLLDDNHRTSTFFSFRKLHDTKIAALEQRVANLLGCWVHQIEALQLVRYAPGQFFGVHHDMGDLMEDDQVRLPRKNSAVKRRLVTIFCYLNTLEKDAGGDTYFPRCNVRVHPQRGRAVLWSNVNVDGQADPRTVHAGEPVKAPGGRSAAKKNGLKGNKNEGCGSECMKYGLNIWICEE